MEKLYYQKKNNAFVLVIEKKDILKCCRCEKTFEIGHQLIIHNSFTKKEHYKKYYCFSCVKTHIKLYYDAFITVTISSIIPSDSVLIFDIPPSLSPFRDSRTIFDAVQLKSDEVIDKTKYSDRIPSLKGAEIGADIFPQLEIQDQELKGFTGCDYIDKIKDAKPMIQHIQQKRIKHESGAKR